MKAVSNGTLNYVSASQIATFDPSQEGGCNRRWYFDKVLGMKEPSTKSQEKGTDVHNQIENYLTSGEKTLGTIALAGERFLPQPGLVEVELAVKGFSLAGVRVEGRIDCLNDSQEWIDEDGKTHAKEGREIEIIDWKTTSNLKYAKSGADLYNTIQMPLYAQYAIDRMGALQVRFSHVYFTTRGAPQAKKSTALFSLDEIAKRTQTIETVVGDMKQAATMQAVEELPPNVKSCFAYGRRCAHWDHCPRSSMDHSIILFGPSTTGETTMGLFDNLTKSTNSQASKTNGQAPMPSPAMELPIAPIAKLSQKKTVSKEDIDRETAKLEEEQRRALDAFGVQSVLPPDAKPSFGEGTYEPEPKDTYTMDLPMAGIDVKKTAPTPAVVEAIIEHATPTKETLELFINVSVSGIEVNDLQPVINKALRQIETQYNVLDVRLATNGPLAFGAWKGVLASLLKDYQLTGRWIICGQGDFIGVAVEALLSQASFVVKGF